jgi:hypothetical protein
MMVFLNDRIPSSHDCDGRVASLEIVTRPLGSVRFATVPGPEDTAQEQLALESSDDASSTSGRTAVENTSK